MVEADHLGHGRRGDGEPGLGLQCRTGQPETGFIRIGRSKAGLVWMSWTTQPEVVMIRVLKLGLEFLYSGLSVSSLKIEDLAN